MDFVNLTKNTIYLSEIDKSIPYLGDISQFISPDDIKKSSFFQELCIQEKIKIIGNCTDRIEQNLLKIQNGLSIKSDKKIKVCVRGHFYSNTGYSKVNKNLVLGLSRNGCDVSICPINREIDSLNEIEVQHLDLLSQKEIDDESIVIDSCIPTFTNISRSKYSILYTTVEACSVPKQFIECCNLYNEVWVPSYFCKEVLQKHDLSRPIFVIPNSVDTSLYSIKQKSYEIIPKLKNFVFVSVFGWNYRKGYDALLKAYLSTFNKNDDVSLFIVSKYNKDISGQCKIENEIKEFIKKYNPNNSPHIARYGDTIIESIMPKIYKSCHAFVLPSRGEGFGLPYMEASLCGLPVIATNHSGHTMFLKENNSSLVNIDNFVKTNKMDVHYWDNELFPDLTSDEFIKKLSESMKSVYLNYEDFVDKNEILRNEIINNYSIDKIGILAKNRLNEIYDSI